MPVIECSTTRYLSAAYFVEAAAIIDGSRDPIASRRFDDLIKEADIIVEPVTEVQARIAREAYRDFGKDSCHLAKLNFGDCFSYVLAKVTGEPLLFKGDDFLHTLISSRPSVESASELGRSTRSQRCRYSMFDFGTCPMGR